MRENKKKVRCLTVCWGCFICVMLAISCPAQSKAARAGDPRGKIIFEDKQAGVKIIKTEAGVILKITTDKQGRVRVVELEGDPMRSAGR